MYLYRLISVDIDIGNKKLDNSRISLELFENQMFLIKLIIRILIIAPFVCGGIFLDSLDSL